ncbi:MAG: hypothetical protein KIT09_05535 [Bryobacteraceae bacterium]|nr:hypothetical protein [Bryobacteraceae bacterium]
MAAARFDAGQKTVSGIVRLTGEGDPIEDGAPRRFPYFLLATPQPDRTLLVSWAEPYATLVMTVDRDGGTSIERFDDLATKIVGVGPPGGYLRDRAGGLLRLGQFVVGGYPGQETHLVRLLPGGLRDESFPMPERREGARQFHPLPSGGFLLQFGPDAEAPIEEYDAEGRLLRALDKIGKVTAVSVRSDGVIFAATDNTVFQIGRFGTPEEAFPVNGPMDAIHAEPDGAVVTVRRGLRPLIEKYRSDGEPDARFNDSLRSLAAEGDALRVLARLDSGDLVVVARRPGQGSRLYWIAPDGRLLRQRDY